MNNIIKIVFVIIGTIIGAGFASGQEVNIFFFSFGIKGIIGIIISSIIIGIIIYKTLKLIKEKDIENYEQFLNFIIKNKKCRNVVNMLVNIFFLITFYIMIAGFGAYLEQEYNINSILGSAILSVMCFIIFKQNIKGFIKVNEIVIPILILFLILIGLINCKNIDFSNINNYLVVDYSKKWLLNSIIYASYNSILLIPILITVKDYIKKEKNIKYIAIISTIIILLLLIIIYLFLINIDINIQELEMPVVYSMYKISKNIKNIYGIMILISIFTTAISLGISFLKNTCENQKKFTRNSIFICITSIVFSKIGFSNLVNIFYPILGILGIIQIFQILKKDIAKKYKNWYNISNKR